MVVLVADATSTGAYGMPQYFSKGCTPVTMEAGFNALSETPTRTFSHATQVTAPYVLSSRTTNVYTRGSGTAASAATSASIALLTGATSNSCSIVQSQDYMFAGSGVTQFTKFAASFATPAANTLQLVGYGLTGEGFFFGFNGLNFGVLVRRGGSPQVVTLTVTTAGGALPGTMTVTLNGVATSLAIVANATIPAIVALVLATAFPGWTLTQLGNAVIFSAITAGSRSGTYSVTQTTTAARATLAISLTGLAFTDSWVYQNAWNADVCDGSADLPALVPTGNSIYQISVETLAYGQATFWVADSLSGTFLPVHSLSLNTLPMRTHESYPTMAYIDNLTTTSSLSMSVAAMASYRYGDTNLAAFLPFVAYTNVYITITQNLLTHLMSIKNSVVFANSLNKVSVRLISLSFMAAGSNLIGQNTCYLVVAKNAAYTNMPAAGFSWTPTDAESACLVNKATSFQLSGGQTVFAIASLGTTQTVDLHPYKIQLSPGDELNLGVYPSQTNTNVQATFFCSLSWQETC